MKRVLVTGATGFIGSQVARQFVDRGWEVAVVRRPNANLWRLGDVASRCRLMDADLRQPDTLRDAIRDFRPDVVTHLAWHGVGNALRNEVSQAEANLRATLELVELAAHSGASAWIGAGSQAEYGPHAGPLDEDAPTRPTTLYGAAKLSAYHLAGTLARLRGMRFAWLRLFSIFGPADNPGWLIPTLIRALARRERPALTPGQQRWDYLHVDDAAAAFVAVAESASATGAFNVGSGEARPLREMIELLRDCVDPSLPLGFGELSYRPDQVMFLQADIRKLRNATGWRPRRDLNEALRETAAWYLANPE